LPPNNPAVGGKTFNLKNNFRPCSTHQSLKLSQR